MNLEETTQLTMIIRRICPAQKWDDETPLAWNVLLENIRIEDAKLALRTIAARQTFIAPADIISEVKRIRTARLVGIDEIPPNVDPANAAAWGAELAALRSAAADGHLSDAETARYRQGGWTLSGAPATPAALPATPRPITQAIKTLAHKKAA
jgi:hypothetical protein